MKFIVKNVPPHKGKEKGEDLICSSTENAENRFEEIGHINDHCEKGCRCEPVDSNRALYQHRIYNAPNITDTQSMPQYLYMWVEDRVDFNSPKKIELKDDLLCEYPVYEYSTIPLMKK